MRRNRRLDKNSAGDDPTVLIVRPTKEAIKAKISGSFKTERPIEGVIRDLNPILRG